MSLYDLFFFFFTFSGKFDKHKFAYPVIFLTNLWYPVAFLGVLGLQKLISPLSLNRHIIFGNSRTYFMGIIIGVLNCMSVLVVLYSGVNTPSTVQASLRTSVIFFTVLAEIVILRKSKTLQYVPSMNLCMPQARKCLVPESSGSALAVQTTIRI